jgi:hypothetical protein
MLGRFSLDDVSVNLMLGGEFGPVGGETLLVDVPNK